MLFFSWVSGDQFLDWGWRIPFFISIVMVGIGLWIRLGILETPVFQKILDEDRVERVPVLEVFKRQPKQVAADRAVADAGAGAGLYRRHLHLHLRHDGSRRLARFSVGRAWSCRLSWASCGSRSSGHLSDRVGRKNMYMIGCVFIAIFGFVYFALLDTKIPGLIFLAVAVSLIPVMTMYGPEAALIAESFTPRLRYSGSSLGYQFASIIAGGPSPFIATALFATFHSSLPIALYILACAVIGIIATAMLTDYTNKDISAEYESV